MSNERRIQGGAVKAKGDRRIGGYLVRFTQAGDPDLHGEYFTKATDFNLTAFPIQGKPILIEHGSDQHFKAIPIGLFDFADEDEIGLYVEGRLYDVQDYERMLDEQAKRQGKTLDAQARRRSAELAVKAVDALLDTGKAHFSSGALPQAVMTDDNGHIDRWHIIEGSVTLTPAEPDGTEVETLRKAFREVQGASSSARAKSAEALQDRIDIRKPNDERGSIMMTPEQKARYKEVLAELLEALSEEMDITEEEMLIVEAAMLDELDEIEDEAKAEDAEELDEEDKQKALKALKAGINALAKARDAKKAKARQLVKSAVDKARQAMPQGVPSGSYADADASESLAQKARTVGRLTEVAKTPLLQAVRAAKKHQASWGDNSVKAQNPYIGTLGGYLVGQDVAESVLEPLRAQVVAFEAGVRQTSVSGIGAYVVPKMTTAPTAFRPGINQNIDDSEAEFDTITAYLRPIASQVIIPRQLIETSPFQVEQIIRDQMVRSIRLQIDKEIFYGDGVVTANQTGYEIRGILRTLLADTSLASTNVVTLATNGRIPNYDDLVAAETQVFNGDVEQNETMCWVMNPAMRGTFRSLTDTLGQPLSYQNFGERPYEAMLGYRVLTSTQLPSNETTGTSTTTSSIFFGRFDYAEYVMGNDISFIVDEVTLANNLQIRLIAYTFSDFIIHYPQAFYVLRGALRA